MMTVDTTDDIGHSLKGKSVISAGVVIDFINDLFVLDLKNPLLPCECTKQEMLHLTSVSLNMQLVSVKVFGHSGF